MNFEMGRNDCHLGLVTFIILDYYLEDTCPGSNNEWLGLVIKFHYCKRSHQFYCFILLSKFIHINYVNNPFYHFK